MRVTDNMRLSASIESQSLTSERLLKLTTQATTGERVSMPSDDSAAYSDIVSRDARISTLKSRSQNVTRVASDLDVAEGSLAAGSDIMMRAHEIAIQSANGTLDPTSRAQAALEVDSLKQSLIAIANSKGGEGFLFGGTRTDVPPFDPNGVFVGNGNIRNIEIADGVTSAANTSGATAFTAAGGRDIFADLQSLSNALSTNNVAGIQAAIGQMDGGNRQLVAARVEAGTSSERLRSAADVVTQALTVVKQGRALIAEVDAPETFSALEAAKMAYERGLAVTREILAVSSLQR